MCFKVIIAGGRDFNDYVELKKYCNHLLKNKKNVEIVCGMARGADLLGKKYGEEKGYKIKKFPANWDKFGKFAGYIRNVEMGEYADAAIIFWNGESKGSKHMIDVSTEKNLMLRILIYGNE